MNPARKTVLLAATTCIGGLVATGVALAPANAQAGYRLCQYTENYPETIVSTDHDVDGASHAWVVVKQQKDATCPALNQDKYKNGVRAPLNVTNPQPMTCEDFKKEVGAPDPSDFCRAFLRRVGGLYSIRMNDASGTFSSAYHGQIENYL